jgi:hypothetical protein
MGVPLFSSPEWGKDGRDGCHWGLHLRSDWTDRRGLHDRAELPGYELIAAIAQQFRFRPLQNIVSVRSSKDLRIPLAARGAYPYTSGHNWQGALHGLI